MPQQTDVISSEIAAKTGDDGAATSAVHDPLVMPQSSQMELIELLFFAYRDFIHEPDSILKRDNFGRTHHRILHFVNRHHGMRVAELLEILKITKQSMAPSLRQLIDKGYITQEIGPEDRRQRLLYPTARGRELMLALCEPQSRRMQQALSKLENGDRERVLRFLLAVVSEEDQQQVRDLTER